MSEVILVADNEPDIRRFVEVNLRLEGFDVLTAGDGLSALNLAFQMRPSLAILDVLMPGIDGFEVCRRLRADPRTSHMPVIILTAKSMTVDKVVGLTAGADDYVLKPFDPTELVARVRTTLQRSAELRGSSPLTGLPGNHRITLEIAQRLRDDEPVAVCYCDINDFKAYNDHYGFLRGDEVLSTTADVLRDTLGETAPDDSFLGHVGGDDFVVLCHPDVVEEVCTIALRRFDKAVPALYDPEDAQRGFIQVTNRRGETETFPLISLAIGVASTAVRPFDDHREMVGVATEMKTFLKSRKRNGSNFAIDGRTA